MFIPCRKCSSKKSLKPGYYYARINGFDVVQECDCHARWREQEELDRRCRDAGVYSELAFEDYVGSSSLRDLNCLEKIADNPQKFLISGAMIYISGPNGTQKTSMVKVLGKALLRKGQTVYYTRMNDLIQTLVSIKDFNDEISAAARYSYEKLLSVDFLIVDESFDKSKVTLFKSGYQIPYLDNFIRDRYERLHKPLIFVSNVSPSAIDENLFGKSLKDLINRSTVSSRLEFLDRYSSQSVPTSRTALFD